MGAREWLSVTLNGTGMYFLHFFLKDCVFLFSLSLQKNTYKKEYILFATTSRPRIDHVYKKGGGGRILRGVMASAIDRDSDKHVQKKGGSSLHPPTKFFCFFFSKSITHRTWRDIG